MYRRHRRHTHVAAFVELIRTLVHPSVHPHVVGFTVASVEANVRYLNEHAFIELFSGFVFHLLNVSSRPIKQYDFKVGNAMIYYRFLIFYIS